jgi:hypothetical protein
MTLKRIWENYNLSIVLFVLFVFSWSIQTWAGWMEFQNTQREHGQLAQLMGQEGYVWEWLTATFENWQSEFLQLFTFVVLTTYLVHKGSHESKDTDEKMEQTLSRIEKRLDALKR